MAFDQKSYENIELVLRRHWLIAFFKFIQLILLFVVGFVLYSFAVLHFGSIPGITELSGFILTIYLLIAWLLFFVSLIDYFLDTWIVTDHRIVDIRQCGFFKRNVSELRYPKIEDITVKVQGFIPTMFDYGDIQIQTAAEIEEFKFAQVPNPNGVKDLIFKTYDQYAQEHINGEEVHETKININ